MIYNFIYKFISKLFTKTYNTKPIGLVNFAWINAKGIQTYQSCTFLMDDADAERKVRINGHPPESLITEDHLFYHKVVVPFLNKMKVDDYVDFTNIETTTKSLDFLSGKIEIEIKTLDQFITKPEESSSTYTTEDNIIHVDFTKHSPE